MASTNTKLAQEYQEQIEAHIAWHSNLSEKEAESLLEGKDPFTYLLRMGEEGDLYFISFVQEDSSIKHQFFVLELERNGTWCYKNGSTVRSPNIGDLIPKMMHCEPSDCIPFMSH